MSFNLSFTEGNQVNQFFKFQKHQLSGSIYLFDSFERQYQKLDSFNLIKSKPEIQSFFHAHSEGLKEAILGNYEDALQHFETASQQDTGETDYSINNYCCLGNIHLLLNEQSKAIHYFLVALDRSNQESELAYIYDCLGKVYQSLNEYNKALSYYQKALELNNLINKERGIEGLVYLHLSSLYLSIDLPDLALDSIEKSIGIFKHKKFKRELTFAYLIKAECSESEGNFSDALFNLNRSLELAHTHGYNKTGSEILYKMARVHLETGNQEKGILFLDEAYFQSQLVGHDELSGLILENKGRISIIKDEMGDAVDYLEKAAGKFDDWGNHNCVEASYEILVNIFENQGNYRKALDYSKKVSKARIEIIREEKKQKKLRLEIDSRLKISDADKEIQYLKKWTDLKANIFKKSKFIKEQNKQLRVMNDEIKLFSSVVVSEIREPLNALNELIENFETDISENLNETAIDSICRIKSELKQLRCFVKKIAESPNVKQQSDEQSKIELNACLLQALYNLDKMILENSCVLTSDKLPPIKSNHSDGIQLFQQLIENSILQADKEKPVIKIKSERLKEHVVVSINDNGEKLPKEKIGDYFGLLPRICEQSNEVLDLGLRISKNIVANSNGEIWIESCEKHGNTVFMKFPRV